MMFQKLKNWLLPRDDRFFLMLEQHAEVLGEAAKIMAAFVECHTNPEEWLAGLHRVEHRGDDLVHTMVVALDETFVTPIDREDLHSLATCLDNVIDSLYRSTNAFVTYEVSEFSPAMRQLVLICTEAANVLRDAIPHIRNKRFEELAHARKRVAEFEKRGDDVYSAELSALFNDPKINAKDLLRQKSVLDALEEALDSCQDAADLLENVSIKHA